MSLFPDVCLVPQEEIQSLKARLEKVEKERNELRLGSDRLEGRVRQRTRACTRTHTHSVVAVC